MSAPGIDEGALQFGDALRMIGIPQLGRIARLQATFEQIAAGRAVGEQPRSFGQQRGESISHGWILAWPRPRSIGLHPCAAPPASRTGA